MPDTRFREQRNRVRMWWNARPGEWITKADFPPMGGGGNVETFTRRTRELVELGEIETRNNGHISFYRLATDTQSAARATQPTLPL